MRGGLEWGTSTCMSDFTIWAIVILLLGHYYLGHNYFGISPVGNIYLRTSTCMSEFTIWARVLASPNVSCKCAFIILCNSNSMSTSNVIFPVQERRGQVFLVIWGVSSPVKTLPGAPHAVQPLNFSSSRLGFGTMCLHISAHRCTSHTNSQGTA